MNTMTIDVPLNRFEWPLHPDDYPHISLFPVGSELEIDGDLAVVVSWDLPARKLVVSFDCWDANGAPV